MWLTLIQLQMRGCSYSYETIRGSMAAVSEPGGYRLWAFAFPKTSRFDGPWQADSSHGCHLWG